MDAALQPAKAESRPAGNGGRMTDRFDPILIELMRHEFIALSEEMNMAMRQTARSIVAKEASELSAALLTPGGEVIGQAMIYGLGYVTAVMPYLIRKFGGSFKPGDVFLTNDPYGGASHLPDIVLVKPLFWSGELCGFAAVVEHHSDIGGRFAGGMGAGSPDIFSEGLRLPGVRFYENDRPIDAVRDIIAANVRMPDDVLGDLDAQVAVCRRGEQGFGALLDKYGREAVETCYRQLYSHAEQSVRAILRQIPNGSYSSEINWDDGAGLGVKLALTLTAKDGDVLLDFTGTGAQVPKAYNIPPDMLEHIVAGYFLYFLGEADVPINSGLFAPIRVVIPKGTALNPNFPAAVGGRGMLIWPTIDILNRVLAQALPGRLGADGEGGSSSMVFAATLPSGKAAIMPDIYASGWGARPTKDGVEGAMPLLLNMYLSAPTEAFERELPILLEGCGFVPDTGGPGKYRGALSVYRRWRYLADGNVMLRTNNVNSVPEGRNGGRPGTSCEFYLISNGERKELPRISFNEISVRAGDVLVHVQQGTGGYGDPFERDPQRVLADVIDGKHTSAYAEREYGVAVDLSTETVDLARTAVLREAAARNRRPAEAVK